MSEDSSSSPIPEQVTNVLKSMHIGYLSVTSKKGDSYIYPLAFHYENQRIYFVTPTGTAKMKFIKANPNVSFIVDNRKVTFECCGAMFQGRARVFSMVKLVTSLISRGAMARFSKKYPGMMAFYVRGKNLPPERKFYKYRLIRIDPAKIIHWSGYTFRKYVPPKPKTKEAATESLDLESKVAGIAGLVDSADEELEMDEMPRDEDWLAELKGAVATGLLSEEERAIIGSFRLPQAAKVPAGKAAAEERDFLKKWKASRKD